MEAENTRLNEEARTKQKSALNEDRNWMSSFGSSGAGGMQGGRLGTAAGQGAPMGGFERP